VSKFQVSLIDADGTIFKKHKCWTQLDGHNANALTPEFLKTLETMEPNRFFEYVNREWYGNVNIVVTGRLPEHKDATLKRIHELFCQVESQKARWSFVSSKWDDKLPDDGTAYADYVQRKADTLSEIYTEWDNVLNNSNIPHEIRIYEDDKNVLSGVDPAPNLKTFLMNEGGTKAMPYGEK
jgi:hypothetical protein